MSRSTGRCSILAMLRDAAFLPVFLALTLCCGCAADPTQGYSMSSLYRADVTTVAVPIFTNDTFVRDLEFELTDALIKELQRRTPYKVRGEAHADTVLSGAIREVELDQLSKSPLTGLSEEVIVSVTIDWQWKDARTGRVLLERRRYAGHGLFVPSRPTGEPIQLGRFAAVQQLARDMVSDMRAEW